MPVCLLINSALFFEFPSGATKNPISYLDEDSFSKIFSVAVLLFETI